MTDGFNAAGGCLGGRLVERLSGVEVEDKSRANCGDKDTGEVEWHNTVRSGVEIGISEISEVELSTDGSDVETVGWMETHSARGRT